MRLVDLDASTAAARTSTCRSATADRRDAHDIDDLALPMPGRHNVLERDGGDRRGARARHCRRRDPQGARRLRRRQAALHPHRRVERRHRSSTTTAIIRSRSPPCCGRRASRRKGRVIAVVQPHRYTRLRDLFDEFCTCFNDADTVIVAAGLCGRRGADRGRRPRSRWSRACARAATATSSPLDEPAATRRRSSAAWRKPGDYRRLPRRRQHHAMGLRAAGRTGRRWASA